jgi:hypothetical protein
MKSILLVKFCIIGITISSFSFSAWAGQERGESNSIEFTGNKRKRVSETENQAPRPTSNNPNIDFHQNLLNEIRKTLDHILFQINYLPYLNPTITPDDTYKLKLSAISWMDQLTPDHPLNIIFAELLQISQISGLLEKKQSLESYLRPSQAAVAPVYSSQTSNTLPFQSPEEAGVNDINLAPSKRSRRMKPTIDFTSDIDKTCLEKTREALTDPLRHADRKQFRQICKDVLETFSNSDTQPSLRDWTYIRALFERIKTFNPNEFEYAFSYLSKFRNFNATQLSTLIYDLKELVTLDRVRYSSSSKILTQTLIERLKKAIDYTLETSLKTAQEPLTEARPKIGTKTDELEAFLFEPEQMDQIRVPENFLNSVFPERSISRSNNAISDTYLASLKICTFRNVEKEKSSLKEHERSHFEELCIGILENLLRSQPNLEKGDRQIVQSLLERFKNFDSSEFDSISIFLSDLKNFNDFQYTLFIEDIRTHFEKPSLIKLSSKHSYKTPTIIYRFQKMIKFCQNQEK